MSKKFIVIIVIEFSHYFRYKEILSSILNEISVFKSGSIKAKNTKICMYVCIIGTQEVLKYVLTQNTLSFMLKELGSRSGILLFKYTTTRQQNLYVTYR